MIIIASGVIQGDFDAGMDRVVQVTYPEEHPRIAAPAQLVVEVELEVAEPADS